MVPSDLCTVRVVSPIESVVSGILLTSGSALSVHSSGFPRPLGPQLTAIDVYFRCTLQVHEAKVHTVDPVR